MQRVRVYRGPDESNLDKFEIQIDSENHTIRYSNLTLVKEETIHPSLLLKLFLENSIVKNPLQGFNGVNGLSIYHIEIDTYNCIISLGEVNRGLYEVVVENIFDKNDIDQSVILGSFSKLMYSHDPEIIGAQFPQITKFHGADVNDIAQAQKKRTVETAFFENKTFVAKLGAKSTDFISSALLAYAGFFTSSRVQEVVEYPAFFETEIQFTNDVIKSHFWTIENAEIDYESSVFAIRRANGSLANLEETIKGVDQLKQKAAEIILEDISSKLFPVCLMLEKPSEVISMPGDHAFLISNELVRIFEEKEFTGWEVEKYPATIFVKKE